MTFLDLAETAAKATDSDFYIGVRAGSGQWFAACAGIEQDADEPEAAVRGVVAALQTEAKGRIKAAKAEAQAVTARYSGLLAAEPPT